MKKLKLYLETSVWNFLFHDDAPEKTRATMKLFEEIENGKYSIYVSEIVLNEINKSDYLKQEQLFNEIRRYDPVILGDSDDVEELINFYLENQLLSLKQLADISHVAVATVNEIDVLVSWNMRHIVKRKTRAIVNGLNQVKGYHTIDICTPEEVIENDNE